MKPGAIWKSNAMALLACLALLPAAHTAETPPERGKRVVYEALQALGGDAFLRMDGRIESGRAYSFYNKQISGLNIAKIYTRYLAPVPGKLEQRERENFGLKEDSAILLTENEGWQINYHGALPMDADTFERYRVTTLRNIFYILRQRLKEPDLSFYSQGTDMVDNRPVEVVDITDADTNTVTVDFDARSKLPVRQSFRRRNQQFHDFDTEVTLFGLYRNVGGGVMWPYNVRRERNGEKIYEMISDQVSINQDLKDNLFSLAIDQKMMKKR
jgi:hypothetical protein